MLKKIKEIKKAGIYRDFVWSDSSCFKRYNAIYGFNGAGKSTLARIFQSLDGSKLEYKETGTSIVFENYEGQNLQAKEDAKNLDILVCDEDFISNNLKWDQGIKSFVVLGKRSKEDEERLKKISKDKEEVVAAKKILEGEKEVLEDSMGDLATKYAADLGKELVSFKPDKFKRYDKRHFIPEASKFSPSPSMTYDRGEIPKLIGRAKQSKLDDVKLCPNLVNDLDDASFKKGIQFSLQILPTQSNSDHTRDELKWMEEGLVLHESKSECLFCLGPLVEGRKENIKKDLTNEVSSFIKVGKEILIKLSGISKVSRQDYYPKMFYPEFQDLAQKAIEDLDIAIHSFNSIAEKVKTNLEKKVNFDDSFPRVSEDEYNVARELIRNKVKLLNDAIANSNSQTSLLERQKENSLKLVEEIYFHEYLDKTSSLRTKLEDVLIKINQEAEKEIKIANEILAIEASLQSEAKAVIGINNMIHVFLGRSDLQLEYKEQEKKFEIVRKGKPAKRLSEGEKTAVSVCYFMILVNANQDKKNELVVVIDDPISSLDSNNLYNAYAVLRNNLIGVKQLFVLTHNMIFFRLVSSWFRDLGANESSYFKIEARILGGALNSGLHILTKNARETSTEYVLLYSHLKSFIERNKKEKLVDADFLPYPNMLRKLIEAFLYSKRPGSKNNNFEEHLIEYGVSREIAQKADRFCNDFSHGRFDVVYGQEGGILGHAPEVVENLLSELERIEPKHFASMNALIQD